MRRPRPRASHLAAALLPLAALACRDAPPHPDVLLVTIDTLRADYLHAYGFPHETSPRIDGLAASGVLFERAIAAAPTTGPAHASIMTSLRTREHSIGFLTGETRLEGAPTLAELFQRAGYATGGFVGNVNLRRRTGFDRGFEHFDDELPQVERNRPRHFERIAEATSVRARAWLAAQDARPLFLWVHYQDPHGPYAAPPGYAGRFELAPGPDERPLPVLEDNDGHGGIPRYQALDGIFLPSRYRSRYADEIFYADRFLGELLDAFDARPGEGVVLLTADHGEAMGEEEVYFVHFNGSTPPLAHVPLILRAPGLPPGRRGEPVGHVDVLPTLLELAGLEVPAAATGIALGPFLRERRPLPPRAVICDAGDELSAYRDGSFVRVVELRGAWSEGGEIAPAWGAFTWRPDGAFEQMDDEARERQRVRRDSRALAAYFRQAVPMVGAPPPDADDRARLRALGYLE